MPSRENIVILGFMPVAITTFLGIDAVVADPSYWLRFGLLLGLGVIAPTFVNNYLDARDGA
jgi:hypothetical protein